MSHVRSRRRGRLSDSEELTSEGEELESISSTDHSSDDFESSEEEGGTSSEEEEDNEYEEQSSENESESELNISDPGTSNSKGSKVTTRETIKSSNNTVGTAASPSDTTINVQKEESTTKEENGQGESSSSSSPVQLTNREKQILERREYRRKLAEDPSFVPYVGMFWSHDDRYRDDALRPALDNGPSSKKAPPTASDISEKRKLMRHNSNRPTTTATATTDHQNSQHIQQRRSSKSTKFNKNYRRTPDEVINSKWTHDGYDWLLRMDEKDQQRKQDRSPSQSKQFRRPNMHHKQRREQGSAVNNDVDSANSNWQSFDPKYIQTYGELDKKKKKKDTNDKNESWGDGKIKDDNVSDNDWGNTSTSSPNQAGTVATDNDDWATTQAKKNWKSFSSPATDVWEPSDGSSSVLTSSKDDNKKKKNSKITCAANEKSKKKEKGIATDGWNGPDITDTITDEQLESAAANWKTAHEPTKGDGWETATGTTSSLAKESEWSSDITVDSGNTNKENAREGWGSVHTPEVAKGWSKTPGDGWENDTTSDHVVANDDDWKKNASWYISTNGVDDAAKKHHANAKKDEGASEAWGSWDKTRNFNSKRLDRFQQQQQQQRHGHGRGRGYLSQKKPPTAPPAQQQQQQEQEKSLPFAQQEPESMPENDTQTAKKQEHSTSSTNSFSPRKPPAPVCDFDSTQNASWGRTTSTRDDAWNHNKFIEDKEDQESDVEIILEADDSLSTSWDNNEHVPKKMTTAVTSIVSPPEAQGGPENTNQRANDNIKQSRMDDNWRRRDDPEPAFTTAEDNNAHSNNNLQQQPPLPPNSYYYQQPMNNYMPIATALPQAYGMPLQPVTMHPPQPPPGSAPDSNTNDEQQFMPSAYEANGMVYYGMDPNMYQYYYYPPQPMTMPIQQGGMIVVDDDDGNNDLQDGWGATPPYEEEWEHNSNFKQEHPRRHGHRQRKQQQQQQAFYYYPTNSSQYYA